MIKSIYPPSEILVRHDDNIRLVLKAVQCYTYKDWVSLLREGSAEIPARLGGAVQV